MRWLGRRMLRLRRSTGPIMSKNDETIIIRVIAAGVLTMLAFTVYGCLQ